MRISPFINNKTVPAAALLAASTTIAVKYLNANNTRLGTYYALPATISFINLKLQNQWLNLASITALAAIYISNKAPTKEIPKCQFRTISNTTGFVYDHTLFCTIEDNSVLNTVSEIIELIKNGNTFKEGDTISKLHICFSNPINLTKAQKKNVLQAINQQRKYEFKHCYFVITKPEDEVNSELKFTLME